MQTKHIAPNTLVSLWCCAGCLRLSLVLDVFGTVCLWCWCSWRGAGCFSFLALVTNMIAVHLIPHDRIVDFWCSQKPWLHGLFVPTFIPTLVRMQNRTSDTTLLHTFTGFRRIGREIQALASSIFNTFMYHASLQEPMLRIKSWNIIARNLICLQTHQDET